MKCTACNYQVVIRHLIDINKKILFFTIRIFYFLFLTFQYPGDKRLNLYAET